VLETLPDHDRVSDGILNGMNTTIDSAGRLVIPVEIRRQAGIKEGMVLDIRVAEGRIEIEPAPLKVAVKRRGRLLVAVPQETIPTMTAEIVEGTRKKLRQERVR
jgi:AbrB family looped-hinge helix DNA binding protein